MRNSGFYVFLFYFLSWHTSWTSHVVQLQPSQGLCLTWCYPLGVSISKQDPSFQSGEEYSVDPHLSLVETNMNVLAKAETKPRTKPRPICQEGDSPDLQSQILSGATKKKGLTAQQGIKKGNVKWFSCALKYYLKNVLIIFGNGIFRILLGRHRFSIYLTI